MFMCMQWRDGVPESLRERRYVQALPVVPTLSLDTSLIRGLSTFHLCTETRIQIHTDPLPLRTSPFPQVCAALCERAVNRSLR
jgi:hypothetical protein